MTMSRIHFFLILYFCILFQTFAQNYIDYKPKYNKFARNYILDKIEYTDTETIFCFRYIAEFGYGLVTFFGNKHPERWCIQNADNLKEVLYHIDVRNIYKNDKLMVVSLGSSDEVTYDTNQGDVFTCEIHFKKLPEGMKKVHLWEGLYQQSSQRHFHIVNLKLKTSGDPDLGTFKYMIARLKKFETLIIGKVKSKWLLSN